MALWTKRTGIMLAYPFNENRLRKNFCVPYLVQPKLNGERCRILVNKSNDVTLLSSEENEITSMPHIVQAVQEAQLGSLELDGELYCPGWSLQKIHSAVSRKNKLHDEYKDVSFNLFDLVIENDQFTRLSLIYDHLAPYFEDPLRVVETTPCTNLAMIEALLVDYMKEGYEGIIIRDPRAPYVRRRATTMLKWKPRKHDCYMIVAANEEVDQYGVPKNTLGSLTLTSDGEEFNAGSGMLTHAQRAKYWDLRNTLPGQYALIKYPELTARGIPSHPVLIEISSTYKDDNDEEII